MPATNRRVFLAERMMHQFHGTPFQPDLRQAIVKLGEMLPDGVSVQLDQVADFLSVLPATESQYDPKVFCALTSAVVYRRQLDLRYWSASRDEKTRRAFDPYDLALVDDGWYTLGHCHPAQRHPNVRDPARFVIALERRDVRPAGRFPGRRIPESRLPGRPK
jgi:predicted DNA-binding transcriptional regulator YafY